MRQRKNNNEIKSSESYEQTNISEPNLNQKRKKHFNGVKNSISESKGRWKRKKISWEKNKNKKIEYKYDKKEKKSQDKEKW